MRMMKIACLSSLFVSAAACTTQVSSDVERVASTEDHLYAKSTAIWGTPNIPVCWETSGNDADKALVRGAVKATWETDTGIVFEGWGTCNSSTKSGIRIQTTDGWPATQALGNELNNVVNGMLLNFWFTFKLSDGSQPFGGCIGASRQSCIQAIAVHEFGHALGFAHEQNRGDTPSTCTAGAQGENGDTQIGAWDLMSVMNYCNPTWNGGGKISTGDVDGARRYYGYPVSEDQQFLAADANGDGRADMLQTWRSWGSIPTCTASSTGAFTCANPGATLYDAGSPSQTFLTGDFNGDGRADTFQAFRSWGSFPTCTSTGSGWSCSNPGATLYDTGSSEQRFLTGKFNADSRTDIVQVYRKWHSIPLCVSTGSGWSCSNPAADIYDSGSIEQQFLSGDVDGDGKADVLQTYRGWGSIPRCISTGTGWSCNNPAASIFNSDNAEQRFLLADVNADGRQDVLQTYRGWHSIPICRSSGSGWSCTNAAADIYDSGSHEQQFLAGDFNGDGYTDVAQTYRGWGSIPVCLSTGGSGWSCSNLPATIFNSGSNEQRFIAADVNGDGKTDIVQAYRGWGSYPVCLSTGSGWSCTNQPATIYNPGY